MSIVCRLSDRRDGWSPDFDVRKSRTFLQRGRHLAQPCLEDGLMSDLMSRPRVSSQNKPAVSPVEGMQILAILHEQQRPAAAYPFLVLVTAMALSRAANRR